MSPTSASPEFIELLNHGYVRLVDSMGSDLSVSRSARVSYDADWRAGEDKGSDASLINYLMKNHHTSPFESVTFTFEISCPMFVARQWMRHRTFSFNEISARYAVLPSEMYVPDEDKIGVQNEDNKQMRDMVSHDPVMAMYIHTAIEAHNRRCYALYEDLIEKKCPRELARGVLPTNIYTRFFATVDLHNLLHFIRLRDHSHAQYEIRVYAEALLELIRPIVPISVGAFEKHVLSK